VKELDPVIHVPTRLRIMTVLTEMLGDDDSILYTRLQKELGLSAGNLTTHLARLESAGYLSLHKTYRGKRPATYIGLTDQGRQAYAAYRRVLLGMLGGGSGQS